MPSANSYTKAKVDSLVLPLEDAAHPMAIRMTSDTNISTSSASFGALAAFDVRFRVMNLDYSTGFSQIICGLDNAGATARSFQIQWNSVGTLLGFLSSNGSAWNIASSLALSPVGYGDTIAGLWKWIRITWDGVNFNLYVVDGKNQNEPTDWGVSIQTTAAAGGPLFNNTTGFSIGSPASTFSMTTRLSHFSLRNAVGGTVVAGTYIPSGFTRFRDNVEKTWTLSGAAWDMTSGKG